MGVGAISGAIGGAAGAFFGSAGGAASATMTLQGAAGRLTYGTLSGGVSGGLSGGAGGGIEYLAAVADGQTKFSWSDLGNATTNGMKNGAIGGAVSTAWSMRNVVTDRHAQVKPKHPGAGYGSAEEAADAALASGKKTGGASKLTVGG